MNRINQKNEALKIITQQLTHEISEIIQEKIFFLKNFDHNEKTLIVIDSLTCLLSAMIFTSCSEEALHDFLNKLFIIIKSDIENLRNQKL